MATAAPSSVVRDAQRRALAVAALAVGLAGCGTPPRPVPSAPVPPPTVLELPYDGGRVTLTRDGALCALRWQGALHAGALQRLRQALDSDAARACHQRRAWLHGLDGALNDAVTAGAMLRNRGWGTAVPAATVCTTPCWLVLAGGQPRRVEAGATVVLTPLPPDPDFARGPCGGEPSRAQQLTLARYLGAMLPDPTAVALHRRVVEADCRAPPRLDATQALALGLATER
ncbi:hypothetical protein EDC36_101166 [Tepidimonas ignava]|uniref:Uncharacterized protein n=1 Tax=Tepidimonas ignava TaxID=114249 RepID=A0A4R3LMT5_9BURK|nr:hypothetical protein [Tepidimonas ignava]TCS99894.1 hypothetical protein EDC36_101166 [Tepidimonas ignava]TSE23279.1 hypothetical protein Tigna_00662 [Tepidimonas ignava]